MESATILDFAKLLAPITQDNPAGNNLRELADANSLYQQAKYARLAARSAERQWAQGIESAASKANWRTVYRLAIEIIGSQSKDLEVACWLVEALLREYDFAGLRDGFLLLKQLIAQYWPTLYPIADEEGIATVVAPIAGLNGYETEGTLIVPIAMIALTEDYTGGPYALWQYQHAISFQQTGTEPSLATIQLAATASSPLFYSQLYADLAGCQHAFNELAHLLTELCAEHAPPVSQIQQQLTACYDFLQAISKPIVAMSADNHQQDIAEKKCPLADHTLNAIAITSREQALQIMLQVAEYFRNTEPHSPLSYAIERLIRWGKMPLPILLKELILDEQAMHFFYNLTGIPH